MSEALRGLTIACCTGILFYVNRNILHQCYYGGLVARSQFSADKDDELIAAGAMGMRQPGGKH